MRYVLWTVGILAGVYLLLLGGVYVAMNQPPQVFSKTVAHVPMPAFRYLFFAPMWLHARQGRLSPGDMAPDFDLPLHGTEEHVRLSSFRGERPVVLIFGSYT